ncbi:MAG: RNA polymerase sigma-54 factor, partial [Rhodospirillales bacterium]|nr:RNA polymerase sigma-54 factor [Rhodospirillales bacterium]
MALAPRLDLRQSQTLVMTPQLRQAIKLLQYSNVEVSAFVEEELERNPLLERDETAELPRLDRPAPDQVPLRAEATPDVAVAVQTETLPTDAAAPLDADWGNAYDAGGPADGAPSFGSMERRGGSLDFSEDDRGIEDLADARPPLREHLGEQLRLSFADPVDRMVGAHLIALLCP